MDGHSDAFPRAPDAGPSRRRRSIAGPLSLALLACAAVAYWAFTQHGAAPAPTSAAPPPLAVTVSRPVRRNVAEVTDFTGQFSAVDRVDLHAQVSGYLAEIHFTDGQVVHKGDLLFVIDPRPYGIQLQQAAAQLQTATANLDLAGKQLSRASILHRSDFESGEVLDQRTGAQQAAAAGLEQTRAAVRAAQLNLDFTRITAPFDGRIGARLVSVGSLVNGGGASTALASLVSLDPIHLDFDMSEADALAYRRYLGGPAAIERTAKVSLGDEAGWQHTGLVDFTDNQVDRGSGMLHARATLANPDLLIQPGQFARLELPMSAPRPVLLVPDAALATDQSRKVVMVAMPDGSVVPKPVEVGPLDGTLRVISQGLAPNDLVIINGLMRLRPGAKVTPQPTSVDAAAK